MGRKSKKKYRGGSKRRRERDTTSPQGFSSRKRRTDDNNYSGFTIPTDTADPIPRIPYPSDPAIFFRDYVAKRRPALISNIPELKDWGIGRWRGEEGLAYLQKRAGKCEVKVEKKSAQGLFGMGLPKTQMTFGDFIERLKKNDTSLYLTTQETPLGSSVIHPPASFLSNDFPQRPPLLNTLVTHQVNLWMGSSKNGSSSGLHHDFHDNIYVLVRGHKRFTLFSPKDTLNLHTHGQPKKVHPNGLIDYTQDLRVRADGAHAAEVAKYQVKLAEMELDRLKSSNSNPSLVEAAEQKLDELMELYLEQELVDADRSNSSEDFGADIREAKGVQHPDSFSKIPVSILRRYLESKVPPPSEFRGLESAQGCSVSVSAGEMLYLPAGWFHEVTSFGRTTSGQSVDTKPNGANSVESNGQNVHIALNYWLYPPTQPEYSKPYEDRYWEDFHNREGSECASASNEEE